MNETEGMPTTARDSPSSAVRGWLRAEGLAVFVSAVVLYAHLGHSWLAFGILFFAPDLSFLGYMADARTGARVYNLVHSYVGPVLAAVALLWTGRAILVPLIWIAHIGFDRMLGYGLKLPTGFADTHLGRIGRAKPGV